ncbi:MAG: hypothetical protein H7X88_10855 [Gloeobacteraceae cyanobacterium ES-bin-316]|nr:hypothetical protein [Ferruginibacter sp.]
MRKTVLGITSLLCLHIISCTDQYTICTQSKFSNLNTSLRTFSNNLEINYTASSLTLKTLDNNNFVYDQKANISSISNPLVPATDSITYFIKVSTSLPADTFKVFFDTQMLFLSIECGEIIVHNISRISTTKNSIDSIKIVNPAVRNDYENNLKIYY